MPLVVPDTITKLRWGCVVVGSIGGDGNGCVCGGGGASNGGSSLNGSYLWESGRLA